MKKDIGKTLKNIRINKSLVARKVCHEISTPQQMSNIENGEQTPSADKFIMILDRLNVKYDEFIFLLDNTSLKLKLELEQRLAEYVKRQNIQGLEELSVIASEMFAKHKDIYFNHINLIALSMAQLLQTNHDFHSAKEYLHPIKEYLTNVDAFAYYEIALISQCIFMFEIEEALFFGERALDTINKHYTFYKDKSVCCVLLTNLATYMLESSNHFHLAATYSHQSINLAATNNDATRAIHAKIVNQVAHFKLKDGQFDESTLLALIDTFKLLNWKNEYQHLIKFIQKHGIDLEFTSLR